MIKKALIKKTILSYWYKKMGYSGDYKELKQDPIVYSKLNKKYFTFKVRTLFLILFIAVSTYYLLIKSELYESHTAVIVKDLSTPVSTGSLGLSLLGMGSNSQLQDSMILKEYVESLDMLLILDKQFELIKHYKSDNIDFIERLPSDATMEQALEFYRTRIIINYDETSGIVHISFLHTNPKRAKEVVEFILTQVTEKINMLNKKKAQKQLSFVRKEFEKNKKQMQEATAKLEAFQNSHNLLDPSIEATSSNSIIAGLEEKLTQKKIEFKTKSNYLNADNYELSALKAEIAELISSIAQKKSTLSGKGKKTLNKILFEYEKLKMQLDFAIEVYKNSLIQLENVKLEVMKNAKMLSIISKPHLPDGYSYPNKPKVFITILIAMLLLYGIFSMLLAIIKDHKE